MTKRRPMRDALVAELKRQGSPTSSGAAAEHALRFDALIDKARQGAPFTKNDIDLLQKIRATLNAKQLWSLRTPGQTGRLKP